MVRVRPLLPHELDKGEQSCCEVQDENTVLIRSGLAGNNWRQYAFDACVQPGQSQKQFFQECGVTNLLESAVQGYSATVLAYGQTGSGKTHTMMGRHCSELASKHDEGLIIRSAKRIFRIITGAKGDGGAGGTPSNTSSCYTVRASFTEIFNAPGAVNECICDLLSPEGRNLQVRHNQRFGFYLTDVSVVDCRSSSDVRAVLEAGLQNRRIGAHQLNKDSSRSHALFSLYIDYEEAQGAGPSSTGEPPLRRHGKITFVDLAGSERLKESCAEGNARKETQAINKSLFTLGQVISQLAEGKSRKHVPYRNSKLTQLLQDSFGGEALCLMVTCINPAHAFAEESLNSLNYAQKAMNIRNRPIVRLDERQKVVQDLKTENAALKRELEAYRTMFGALPPDVLAKFANTGGALPLGLLPTTALEGSSQQQQTLGPAAAAVAAAAASARGAGAVTLAPRLPSPANAQETRAAEAQETRIGSRSSSKQSLHIDTPRSASCGRPRGGPDAGKDSSNRRSVSASEVSGKKSRGAADLVSAPPPARPQRPPVPAATAGGYACAAVKRRIQPEPSQPQRSSGAARQEPPRRELPPLPGSRGSPTRVMTTSSPAGASSAHSASPGAASKMMEAAQPKLSAHAGGPAPEDSSTHFVPTPTERPHVPTLKAPPSKRTLAAAAAASAGPPQSPSPAALQAEASAREAAGTAVGNSPLPLRSTLARTNSSDHIAHLTRKQLDHLDALHASEWQFDFGRPRHGQAQEPEGGRGSRRGNGSEYSSRACSAERQSSCDGRGSGGGMRGTRGLDSVDTSAGTGSGYRGAGGGGRGGGRGQEADGRSEASGRRRKDSTGSGSRDGTLSTGGSRSSSASSSRSSSASPDGSEAEDAGDGGPGQAMKNLSLAELNAKLASMQMATVALMQPQKA